MEQVATARALTHGYGTSVATTVTGASAEYALALASLKDDREIRRMLRDTVFPGAVRLSLEREPDSLAAAAIEGEVHQTIVARHVLTDEIAAIASRAVRRRFVNGVPAQVGYLGQLRIGSNFRRRRRLLDAGFDFCRRLHEGGDARVYLASVVSENHAALRLLARRSASWPRFQPIGHLSTLAIPVRRGQALSSRIDVTDITESDVHDVVECLRRNNARYQFAPDWTAEELTSSTPGLSKASFRIAERCGRVVGCAALWDQRALRQVVVRGYAPLLGMFRLIVNAAAPWTGVPPLPPVNTRLEFGYVSHLAADDDDPEVACALISAVCQAAKGKGLEYVVIGLPAGAALTHAVRARFRHRAYESVLHVAFWSDGEQVASTLDGRAHLPELGTL